MTQATHELERSVLAGIATDPSVLREVSPLLDVEDFDQPAHARVYRAICGLYEGGEQVTLESVAKALEDSEVLADLGGPPGLAEILGHEATAAFVPHHARLVRRESLRRQRRVAVAELQHAIETEDRGEPTQLRPRRDLAALDQALADLESGDAQRTEFEPLPDDVGYRLTVPSLGAIFEATYLRRERYQLKAEVLCRCTMPGSVTIDGVLSVGETNLSSTRSRRDHAAHLAQQARTQPEPWRDAVEELAQRVLAAEREGGPDVSLAEVQPDPVRVLDVEGLRLPRCHPTVIFGDGDSGKSYVVLWLLGELARQGLRTGLADWELSETDHRERLGRLFGGELPGVRYLACARSITHEADRIRRWVRERQLDYVAFDSVAYASAGAPESAEIAMAYFQVIRQLGPVGTLHVAHVTKAFEGADRRPFGSTFWHNSPRATWYVKLADRDPGGTVSRLGLYPRKWNIGPLPESVGLELTFSPERTIVRRADPADSPDLAAHLSVRQRMAAALRRGAMGREELAEEIGAEPRTVKRTALRYRDQFRSEGGVIYLLERRQ